MKNNVKKAFTLVELIVVIVILAILATIAILSLVWYSSDARNSKRSSDLGSISTAITTYQTSWNSLLSFIWSNSSWAISASSIVAWTWVISWTDYKSWNPNYTALWLKPNDFKDPSWNNEYLIWITTKLDWKYEVSASIENGAGNRTAKVLWTYTPRLNASSTSASWTVTTPGVFKLDSQVDVGKFKKWDLVTWSTAWSWVVASISSDWLNLTIDSATLAWTTLYLWGNTTGWIYEVPWLTAVNWTSYITNNLFNLPY